MEIEERGILRKKSLNVYEEERHPHPHKQYCQYCPHCQEVIRSHHYRRK